MEIDFGYGSSTNSNDANKNNSAGDNGNSTNITNGKLDTDDNGVAVDDIEDVSNSKSNNNTDNEDANNTGDAKDDKNKDDDKNLEKDNHLEKGTSIEIGENTYTVDENGNVVDKDGNIFKEAKDVNDWLKEFENVENDEENITIEAIQNAIGVQITDDNDKPVEFENNIQGIKSYVDSVIEASRDEHYETAINTLYQKYPILSDVLNYYIANGNSLEGFNEIPDRSGIIINDSDEAQQEAIIRTAWKEQGRRGDLDGYIQYLKSSGTLLSTAKEELAGLQEADNQYRKDMEKEAERKENENIKKLEEYWNGVHDVIKNRKIAGYQIPETIVINRDGQKISVTPEDFFNYIYRVDDNGMSAYERALAEETTESRRDDEILRAYLKFVGGNYSNLVDMAINKQKVDKLRLRAKERNTSTIRINKPQRNTNKNEDIDFGYN